ncbi:MAG: DUF2157 domain-containing protein [Flavipsychrobacter sp.]|nr:DUF2157 domain-containing protein [Flavipsychrobacter sp.]
MEVTKQEYEIIQNALDEWGKENVLPPDEVHRLKATVTVQASQRQQIAQYFFIIALSCTLLAFGAIFIDEKLLEQVKKYFSLGNITIAISTALLTAAWFWYIQARKSHLSTTAYEVYHVFGALGVLTSLVYFAKMVTPTGSYTLLFLIASVLLFILSIAFRARSLWICAVLALLAWYSSFSTTHSDQYLFWGMNYPVRFALFGLVLLGFSFIQLNIKSVLYAQRITFATGLVLFSLALWGVSIFGNINYLSEWAKVRQVHVIGYSIVFAAAAIISFWLGIKYKDDLARDMGILFLLINLYTRYFEFFWDSMNKGIFFLVLAVTFGILGHQLQKKKRHVAK